MVACMLMTAALLLSASLSAGAANWVSFKSTKMEFPAGDRFVPGYSESFYDGESARYYDGTFVEVSLRHVTYIGDLVPHTSRELIRIDCLHNSFVSLVEEPGNPGVLKEINRGQIGSESSYVIIRETFCGLPRPPLQRFKE